MATFKIRTHDLEGGGTAVCVFDDAEKYVGIVGFRDNSIFVASEYMTEVLLDHEPEACPVAVIKLEGNTE